MSVPPSNSPSIRPGTPRHPPQQAQQQQPQMGNPTLHALMTAAAGSGPQQGAMQAGNPALQALMNAAAGTGNGQQTFAFPGLPGQYTAAQVQQIRYQMALQVQMMQAQQAQAQQSLQQPGTPQPMPTPQSTGSPAPTPSPNLATSVDFIRRAQQLAADPSTSAQTRQQLLAFLAQSAQVPRTTTPGGAAGAQQAQGIRKSATPGPVRPPSGTLPVAARPLVPIPGQFIPVDEGPPGPLLTDAKLKELLMEIDPTMGADSETFEIMKDVAEDFVREMATLASKFAKHRKSNTLDVNDGAKLLERYHDIRVPGFSEDLLANVPAPTILSSVLTASAARGMPRGRARGKARGRGGIIRGRGGT